MSPRLSILAGALLTILTVSTAEAQVEEVVPNVACPVTKLTESSTMTLPDGWTRPDRSGELDQTSVQFQGGTHILVCRYGRAGVITLDMPANFGGCMPVEAGFVCAERKRESPYASRGPLRLEPGVGIDLDRGTEAELPRENDIWFARIAGGMPVIETFNNAAFSIAPVREINDCIDARFTPAALVIGDNVSVGGNVCYRTNKGRIGVFSISRADTGQIRLLHRTLR